MAQDFYQRTQALHEEFQKNELHYLNAEKQWSSMIWKKDPNPSLQEYLKKINQQERETEETYNSVMKQMTELDKRTDMMSFKLEKLRILRGSVAPSEAPYRSSNLPGSNLHLYEPASSLCARTSAFNFSMVKDNSKSVSTQTQNKIYCDTCNSQVFDHSFHSNEIENLPKSSPSIHAAAEELTPQIGYSSRPLYSSTPLKENPPKPASSVHSVHFSPLANADNSFVIESEIDGHIDSQVSKQDIHSGTLFNESGHVPQSYASPSKEIRLNKSRVAESDKRQSNYKEAMKISRIETELTVSNKSEPLHLVNIEDATDISVSKSDQESVNNEFDFLESDAIVNKKNQADTKPDESFSHSVNPSFVKPEEKLLGVKDGTKNNISKISVTGHKSDTSGSITEPPSPSIHSPSVSAASDSDSMGGKENPLTASAAYQALLGNTTAPVKVSKKQYSDSESEDEAEHALASAVKKNSHIPPKSLPQPKKEEKSKPLQQEDSKHTTKASKPAAVSKPQSKLSKSTRKVLGLDTSSGSEVELAVKPAEKKIEEDSDEFDFYG